MLLVADNDPGEVVLTSVIFMVGIMLLLLACIRTLPIQPHICAVAVM